MSDIPEMLTGYVERALAATRLKRGQLLQQGLSCKAVLETSMDVERLALLLLVVRSAAITRLRQPRGLLLAEKA